MRTTRIFFILFVLTGLIVNSPSVLYADLPKAKKIIKLATLAPDGVGWSVYLKKEFAPAISKATEGEVLFKFYWGGVMGDDEDYLAKMKIDQLQAAGVSAAGIVMACPDIAVFELPFLFNNFEEVAYIRDKLRPKFNLTFEKNGFKLLILIDQGFDLPWSTKRKLINPEDFINSKFLTWCAPIGQNLLKSLGVSPIPVDVPEVPQSMRSGVANAFLAPPIYLLGTQLYTIVKYVTPCKIRYSPGGIMLSTKAWNSISDKSQKAIEKIMPRLEHKLNKVGHKTNKNSYKAMVKYGVEEVKLTSDDLDTLKKLSIPLWDKLAGDKYPKTLLDEIIKNLKEFRDIKGQPK